MSMNFIILNDLIKIDVLGLHTQKANHKSDNTVFTSNIYSNWAGFLLKMPHLTRFKHTVINTYYM